MYSLVSGLLSFAVFFVAVSGGLFGALLGLRILKLYEQEEGTASVWLIGGKYCCTTLQYIEHHFDQNADPKQHNCIVPDRNGNTITVGPNTSNWCWAMFRPFAGYIFYVTGLVKPALYENFSDKEDGFGKESRVFLHTLTKQLDMKKVDSNKGSGGETTPLDIVAVFRMRITNIYKFLFVAPKDAVAEAMVVMEMLVRDLVRAHKPDEVFDMKANSTELWTALTGVNLGSRRAIASVRDLHDEWGIEILPEKVAFRSIDYQKADEEAVEAERQQRFKARGEAQELLGSLLEIAAVRLGVKDGVAARTELEKTPEGKKRLDDMESKAQQTVFQRKKASAGGYKEINIPGLPELVTAILAGFGKKM